MFANLQAFAGDPILTLNEAFGSDPRPNKVNLSIGVYMDGDGRLPVMGAVRSAEEAILHAIGPKPYLPMAGNPDYRRAVQLLLFGEGSDALKAGRIATIQTLGGSGALKVGSDFLRKCFPDSGVWISDPTWDNHRGIFEGSGFRVDNYPYFDSETGGLAFSRMIETMRCMPERSIVVLHACCHNPTGVDPSVEQWSEIVKVLSQRNLIPFIDIAYQGFGAGLAADAAALREMVEAGLTVFVASSLSKNFGLYGERCGALSAVCATQAQSELILGQLQAAVRKNYSSPPAHGARIVTHVLGEPALYAAWSSELEAMRVRIDAMRQNLHTELSRMKPGYDFGYLRQQRGMFSYTGMTAQQVDLMRDRHAVYLVRSGRMCMAGVNRQNVEAIADAMTQVLDVAGV